MRAVDDLSFTRASRAGSPASWAQRRRQDDDLRCLLGLVRPTSGTATFDGTPYAELADPAGTVGAALEATGFHPGRTGRDHLRVLCLRGRAARPTGSTRRSRRSA